MILTAHQPVYLPWLGLFHKIASSDVFISFDQVQYQPKDWNNRNKIKTPNGDIWLTVPVLRKGYLEKKICDIEINNDNSWSRKHWKSIRTVYAKAPYFSRYADFFESTYQKEWKTLVELNIYMLKWFVDTLGIDVQIHSAGEWDFKGLKSDLVLNMCQQLKADDYIFGAEGQSYADLESFKQAGIKVHFQQYNHPTYQQMHGEFISHLSIVDLLFNCGDSSLDILMSDNITKSEILKC